MIIFKATSDDISAVADLYTAVHDAEEKGDVTIGWKRDVYPIRQTAIDALERGDLFVMKDNNKVVACGIINKIQLDCYSTVSWLYEASDNDVMVLHTLVVDPRVKSKGYGTAFVQFYEKYAVKHNCSVLRLDTQEKNSNARKLYARLGYKECEIIFFDGFNGLPSVNLVLLEKKI